MKLLTTVVNQGALGLISPSPFRGSQRTACAYEPWLKPTDRMDSVPGFDGTLPDDRLRRWLGAPGEHLDAPGSLNYFGWTYLASHRFGWLQEILRASFWIWFDVMLPFGLWMIIVILPEDFASRTNWDYQSWWFSAAGFQESPTVRGLWAVLVSIDRIHMNPSCIVLGFLCFDYKNTHFKGLYQQRQTNGHIYRLTSSGDILLYNHPWINH